MTDQASAIPVIAIDGPSGVGKGTLAGGLAAELGWHLLDSGALYRVTAYAAMAQHIALDDDKRLAQLAARLPVRFENTRPAGSIQIFLQDVNISQLIRTEHCASAASQVASLPAVRKALLQLQRSFRKKPGLVADGRDMGTVVFPDATVKLFLSADPMERAKRRYKQLNEQGISASLAALTQEIAERDRRDTERKTAPLKPAADAILLDTTGLSILDVKQQALLILQKRLQ